MISAFRKIVFTDDLINRMQDNLLSLFAGLQQDKFLNRKVIDIGLASGSNRVVHNLGYVPTGWNIVGRNNASTVYDTARDSVALTLQASAAITVTLEVW